MIYDPFAAETQEDPYPIYRYLLEECPVYYNPERGFLGFVTLSRC